MTHNRNRGRGRRIQQHLHRRADFRVRQHLLKRRNEIRSVLYNILQTLFRSGNLIRSDRRQIGVRIHNRCLLSGNLFRIDKILLCEQGQNEQRGHRDRAQDERLRRNLHSIQGHRNSPIQIQYPQRIDVFSYSLGLLVYPITPYTLHQP